MVAFEHVEPANGNVQHQASRDNSFVGRLPKFDLSSGMFHEHFKNRLLINNVRI